MVAELKESLEQCDKQPPTMTFVDGPTTSTAIRKSGMTSIIKPHLASFVQEIAKIPARKRYTGGPLVTFKDPETMYKITSVK
jgi:hypothetical protein